MFRILLTTIMACTLCTSVTAQKIKQNISYVTSIDDAENKYIIYTQGAKLSIEDFKGAVDNNSGAVAITSSGFRFKAGYHSDGENAELTITVYCNFDRQSSWMKDAGKNAYILSHEQLHFDISYIHTLLFIKKIKKLSLSPDNYMEQLKEAYYASVKEMEEMQDEYDTATKNGILKKEQAEWQTKLNKKLQALIEQSN